MDHLWFIALSYLATVVVLVGVVAWLVLDQRALARRIAELDARGIRRRSRADVEKTIAT
jgi:heme exporter protein D